VQVTPEISKADGKTTVTTSVASKVLKGLRVVERVNIALAPFTFEVVESLDIVAD